MDFRGGDIPAPANGGDFLLQLLRRSPASHQPWPPEQPSQNFYSPEAAAAAGTSVSAFSPYLPWGGSPSPPFGPHNYFPQNPNANPNLNPEFSSPPVGPNWGSNQFYRRSNGVSLGHDAGKSGFLVENLSPSVAGLQEQRLVFGSFDDAGNVLRESLSQKGNLGNSYRGDNLGVDVRLDGFRMNSTGVTGNAHGYYSKPGGYEHESKYSNDIWGTQPQNGNFSAVEVPPGFSTKLKNGVNLDNGRRTWDHHLNNVDNNLDNLETSRRLNKQLDSYCKPAVNSLNSGLTFNLEGPVTENRHENGDYREESRVVGQEKGSQDELRNELDDLEDQLVDSLRLDDEPDEKSDKKKHPRDKDYRSDSRGQWMMGQRMRNQKSQRPCRSDIINFTSPFLEVFQTLIPAGEEKIKQKQLLLALENLVSKEWPEARLFLYGSCANSFGFPNSDIDVCLVTQNKDMDKCEMLLRLADILQPENFQNVQALTRARVPIVKLMDPTTGISCDICVNNVLAVVNTKLLRDYSKIDVRLRQLVFIVKHWAKSRRVNETYQGTLSSYAYVLMCIHFLQQRMPPILPCLQGMKTTYFANVDNVDCSYYDQVENLGNFGVRNRESIAQLVWGFFHYWAYCHDYANDVISVRMGGTISKRAKDWTRRVGNDRHLICIEDPFEVSHDLGRVVDKYSIRVLREEFVHAAEVMHYDANPFVTLFEPIFQISGIAECIVLPNIISFVNCCPLMR